MTTIEQLALNRIITRHPNLQILISKLDLDTSTTSQAETISAKVSNRVTQILKEIQYSPVKPRSIIQDTTDYSAPLIFQPTARIEAYLTSIYGQRPWKYPLTSAPF